VRVNGDVVRRGDTAVARVDRVELGAPPPPPFPAPLRLVHADEHVYVIDKPPGLLTIANAGERHHTAYRLLRDWVEAQGGRRILRRCNRLDRETSGLLVFARSPEAKEMLQTQFHHRIRPSVSTRLAWRASVRESEGTLTSRLSEDRSLRVRPDTRGRSRPRGHHALPRAGALRGFHAARAQARDRPPRPDSRAAGRARPPDPRRPRIRQPPGSLQARLPARHAPGLHASDGRRRDVREPGRPPCFRRA
jgi:hypothetical protein